MAEEQKPSVTSAESVFARSTESALAREILEAQESSHKAALAIKAAENSLSIPPDVRKLLHEAKEQSAQAVASVQAAERVWKTRMGTEDDMPVVRKHIIKAKVCAEKASEIARSATLAIMSTEGSEKTASAIAELSVANPAVTIHHSVNEQPKQASSVPEKIETCSSVLLMPAPKALQDAQTTKKPYIGAALVDLTAHVTEFFSRKGVVKRLITALVLLPGLLVFLYLSLWASDMYISEAKFAVRGQNAAPAMDALSSLFRVTTSTQSDSYIVLNYITSLDMCDKLNDKLNLRAHYSNRVHDIWFRLWKHPTQNEMRDYWQWATTVAYDPDTGILSVEVKAFSAEMAHKICQGILENSEGLVNAMNQRARADAISQAQLEVNRAEERIRKAQAAMRTYRERTIILDPQAVASGLYGVVNELEASVTNTTAELAEALTFMQGDSPRVIQLRNRLEVLQKQLDAEKQRLAGDLKQDVPLSALLSEFQSLALEEEFAQKQLTSAMASLETARIQADAQSLYIEAFERPTLPDESLYPRSIYFTFIFMVTALLLLGLVSLIIAAVREHAGF